MRIAFIINTMGGGGAEKTFQTLANYWVETGKAAKITIICTDNDESAYILNDKIKLQALKSGKLIKIIGRFPAMFFQAIELIYLLTIFKPNICISSLARANIVHVLSTYLKKIAPSILCEQTASFTFYKNRQSFIDRSVCKLISIFYPRADSIVAASTLVGDDLIKAGVPAAKINVIYNPVSFQVSPDHLLNRTVQGQHAITIGRLSEEKDHKTLLHAFAIVHRHLPDAKLTIVGQGPLESQLKTLIKELELESCVELPGWDPNPQQRLLKADVFVLTSTSEGFGVVLVEALACGLPSIATDCPGGPREILEDGRSGALVPVGDPESIAREIIRILKLPDTERHELQKRSYDRAARFSINTISDEYLSLLDRMAKRR